NPALRARAINPQPSTIFPSRTLNGGAGQPRAQNRGRELPAPNASSPGNVFASASLMLLRVRLCARVLARSAWELTPSNRSTYPDPSDAIHEPAGSRDLGECRPRLRDADCARTLGSSSRSSRPDPQVRPPETGFLVEVDLGVRKIGLVEIEATRDEHRPVRQQRRRVRLGSDEKRARGGEGPGGGVVD